MSCSRLASWVASRLANAAWYWEIHWSRSASLLWMASCAVRCRDCSWVCSEYLSKRRDIWVIYKNVMSTCCGSQYLYKPAYDEKNCGTKKLNKSRSCDVPNRLNADNTHLTWHQPKLFRNLLINTWKYYNGMWTARLYPDDSAVKIKGRKKKDVTLHLENA